MVNDSKQRLVQYDFISSGKCFCQRRIVGKPHRRPLWTEPVFRMTETLVKCKPCCFKLSAGDLTVCRDGDIDVECGAWFDLMDLKRNTINDGIRDLRVCKDSRKRQESRAFGPFHFALQPEPLTV